MNHRSPRPYTIMHPALNPSISKRGALHIYKPHLPTNPPTRPRGFPPLGIHSAAHTQTSAQKSTRFGQKSWTFSQNKGTKSQKLSAINPRPATFRQSSLRKHHKKTDFIVFLLRSPLHTAQILQDVFPSKIKRLRSSLLSPIFPSQITHRFHKFRSHSWPAALSSLIARRNILSSPACRPIASDKITERGEDNGEAARQFRSGIDFL